MTGVFFANYYARPYSETAYPRVLTGTIWSASARCTLREAEERSLPTHGTTSAAVPTARLRLMTSRVLLKRSRPDQRAQANLVLHQRTQLREHKGINKFTN